MDFNIDIANDKNSVMYILRSPVAIIKQKAAVRDKAFRADKTLNRPFK